MASGRLHVNARSAWRDVGYATRRGRRLRDKLKKTASEYPVSNAAFPGQEAVRVPIYRFPIIVDLGDRERHSSVRNREVERRLRPRRGQPTALPTGAHPSPTAVTIGTYNSRCGFSRCHRVAVRVDSN